jgi:putative transposase
MPRVARIAPGDCVFHVLNRANGRRAIFERPADYQAFNQVIMRTTHEVPMRILAYCVMPNHWHFVLWPHWDGDLAKFVHRLTTTHVRRWHLYRDSVGAGHVYQGAFKSFPIQSDDHLFTVCRYVERNALRAGLVERAEDWKWSSLPTRLRRIDEPDRPPLADWPAPSPRDWGQLVNQPLTAAELEAVRVSVARGRPFGGATWQLCVARQLGLESTFRERGRPRGQ